MKCTRQIKDSTGDRQRKKTEHDRAVEEIDEANESGSMLQEKETVK